MKPQNKPPSRLLLLLDWLFTRTRKNLPGAIFFAVFVLASNAIYDLHQHHQPPSVDFDSVTDTADVAETTAPPKSGARSPSSVGGITPSRNQHPDTYISGTNHSQNEAPYEPPVNDSQPTLAEGTAVPLMPAYMPSSHPAADSETHSVSTGSASNSNPSGSDSNEDSVHDIAQMPTPQPTPYGLWGGDSSIVQPSFQSSKPPLPPISGFSVTSGGGTCTATGILAQVSIGEVFDSSIQTGAGVLAVSGISGVIFDH